MCLALSAQSAVSGDRAFCPVLWDAGTRGWSSSVTRSPPPAAHGETAESVGPKAAPTRRLPGPEPPTCVTFQPLPRRHGPSPVWRLAGMRRDLGAAHRRLLTPVAVHLLWSRVTGRRGHVFRGLAECFQRAALARTSSRRLRRQSPGGNAADESSDRAGKLGRWKGKILTLRKPWPLRAGQSAAESGSPRAPPAPLAGRPGAAARARTETLGPRVP